MTNIEGDRDSVLAWAAAGIWFSVDRVSTDFSQLPKNRKARANTRAFLRCSTRTRLSKGLGSSCWAISTVPPSTPSLPASRSAQGGVRWKTGPKNGTELPTLEAKLVRREGIEPSTYW